ncbi:restriction endonuclease subunit S [Sphingomonas sp. ERG5]|uniref:restriction endonuclease subunit S n=1 Tax=Sphingomonas sp. ERG5 TaxID=1381597 RepID=UPI0006908703|nr:restriction endonuclease subunit S [Sphingomonas sp. ERG5]
MNWTESRLADVLHVKHGFAFKGEFFTNQGDKVVVTPGNFFDEGGFKSKGDNEKFYSGSIPEGYVLKPGSLIVAMTEQAEGLLGSAAKTPVGRIYLHNQRLGLVSAIRPDRFDLQFAYYLFNSRPVRQQIRATSSGTKVRHTSPSRIGEVRVKLPPVTVQRRIGDILSAYDDLIENNTRRIAVLEDMARRLFEEWFGNGVDAGWPSVKLGTVAAINPESIKPKSLPAHIGYIDIASVSPARVDQVQWMDFADAPGRARRIVRHGDVIWSNVRPNRRSFALLLDVEQNTVASTGFSVLRSTAVPWSYLYVATTTSDFTAYLTNRAKGSAYPAVGSEDFADADILLPDSAALDRFHNHAGPMLELAARLHVQNTNLRTTRDLLLPKLISGEIEVRAAEEELETAAA